MRATPHSRCAKALHAFLHDQKQDAVSSYLGGTDEMGRLSRAEAAYHNPPPNRDTDGMKTTPKEANAYTAHKWRHTDGHTGANMDASTEKFWGGDNQTSHGIGATSCSEARSLRGLVFRASCEAERDTSAHNTVMKA